MKLSVRDLKRLIVEVTEDSGTGDSLDAQVDRYLAEYESSAKQTNESRRLSLSALLREADDEEPADKPAGSEASTKLPSDKLDVEAFANDVSRLVDNYDNLLEVRSTLVRRAIAFIGKTYDDEVVSAFADVFRDQHGLVPGTTKREVDDDRTQPPAADRAGPSPTG